MILSQGMGAFVCRTLKGVPVQPCLLQILDLPNRAPDPKGKRHQQSRPPNSPGSVRPNHGAKSLLGQNLQQHGMRYASVDDVDGVDAAFGRVKCASNFGQHTA